MSGWEHSERPDTPTLTVERKLPARDGFASQTWKVILVGDEVTTQVRDSWGAVVNCTVPLDVLADLLRRGGWTVTPPKTRKT